MGANTEMISGLLNSEAIMDWSLNPVAVTQPPDRSSSEKSVFRRPVARIIKVFGNLTVGHVTRQRTDKFYRVAGVLTGNVWRQRFRNVKNLAADTAPADTQTNILVSGLSIYSNIFN